MLEGLNPKREAKQVLGTQCKTLRKSSTSPMRIEGRNPSSLQKLPWSANFVMMPRPASCLVCSTWGWFKWRVPQKLLYDKSAPMNIRTVPTSGGSFRGTPTSPRMLSIFFRSSTLQRSGQSPFWLRHYGDLLPTMIIATAHTLEGARKKWRKYQQTDQTTNPPTKRQATKHPTKQKREQPINQQNKRPINQPINQTINQQTSNSSQRTSKEAAKERSNRWSLSQGRTTLQPPGGSTNTTSREPNQHRLPFQRWPKMFLAACER